MVRQLLTYIIIAFCLAGLTSLWVPILLEVTLQGLAIPLSQILLAWLSMTVFVSAMSVILYVPVTRHVSRRMGFWTCWAIIVAVQTLVLFVVYSFGPEIATTTEQEATAADAAPFIVWFIALFTAMAHLWLGRTALRKTGLWPAEAT